MFKLLKSFGYAFKGLYTAFREERNFRLHVLAIVVVCIAGVYLELAAIEWAVIAAIMGLVICMELMNTALEDVVNLVSPQFNEKAGRIKDISAGAVLIAAIIAAVVGLYIFGNKIFNLLL